MPTHEVLNQPPPLEGYNVFAEDRALREGLAREGGGWAEERCQRLGAITTPKRHGFTVEGATIKTSAGVVWAWDPAQKKLVERR